MSKKRGRLIVVCCALFLIAGFLVLIMWLGRSKMADSLYNESSVLGDVDIDLKIDSSYDQIIYVLYNRSSQEITYTPVCVIEYYDGSGWREVLTRTGRRASEGSIEAIEYSLSAADNSAGPRYSLGVKHLNDLSHMPDGQYRLVIPVSNDEKTVMASNPFYWGE